jgi:hypothetical protein
LRKVGLIQHDSAEGDRVVGRFRYSLPGGSLQLSLQCLLADLLKLANNLTKDLLIGNAHGNLLD